MVCDRDLSKLHPGLRSRIEQLLSQAHAQGLTVEVFEAYRSFEEQQERYDREVSRERPGYSWHQYGLACDLAFKAASGTWSWDEGFDWQAVGGLGKGLGLEWGGDWPELRDLPHFQLRRGMSIDEAYNRYHAHGMGDVWLDLTRRASDRPRLSLGNPMLRGMDVMELQWRLLCLKYLGRPSINGVFDGGIPLSAQPGADDEGSQSMSSGP